MAVPNIDFSDPAIWLITSLVVVIIVFIGIATNALVDSGRR